MSEFRGAASVTLDTIIAKALQEWSEMPWHGGIPQSTQEGALVGMIRDALLAKGFIDTLPINGSQRLIIPLDGAE